MSSAPLGRAGFSIVWLSPARYFRRAAGFSTDLAYPELVELLCARVRAQQADGGG